MGKYPGHALRHFNWIIATEQTGSIYGDIQLFYCNSANSCSQYPGIFRQQPGRWKSYLCPHSGRYFNDHRRHPPPGFVPAVRVERGDDGVHLGRRHQHRARPARRLPRPDRPDADHRKGGAGIGESIPGVVPVTTKRNGARREPSRFASPRAPRTWRRSRTRRSGDRPEPRRLPWTRNRGRGRGRDRPRRCTAR